MSEGITGLISYSYRHFWQCRKQAQGKWAYTDKLHIATMAALSILGSRTGTQGARHVFAISDSTVSCMHL